MSNTIPPYGENDAETTVFAENLYPVTYVASQDENIGIMVQQNFFPYNFFDWSTGGFVAQPATLIQPLVKYTSPIIQGVNQRFGFVIAAKAFLDGFYNVWYTSNGTLVKGWAEVFVVYKGTVNTYPRVQLIQS